MESRTCEHCGGKFLPPYPVTQAYWSKRRFCSAACKYEGRKGERRSTFGREMVSLAERFWSKVKKRGAHQCWLWIGARTISGYGYLAGTRREGAKLAHRISYEIHSGSAPGDLCVCHKCDNPPCVNPAHLFLGTRADNNADKDKKGRGNYGSRIGEKNGRAKLSYADTVAIRKLRRQGLSQQAIADKFKVSQVTISKIDRGELWTKKGQ